MYMSLTCSHTAASCVQPWMTVKASHRRRGALSGSEARTGDAEAAAVELPPPARPDPAKRARVDAIWAKMSGAGPAKPRPVLTSEPGSSIAAPAAPAAAADPRKVSLASLCQPIGAANKRPVNSQVCIRRLQLALKDRQGWPLRPNLRLAPPHDAGRVTCACGAAGDIAQRAIGPC